VISVDFYPTLLELAGQSPAPPTRVDGVSIVPLLKGQSLARAAPLFWHYPHYGNQGGAPGGVIRQGDWKLVEWYEDGSLELYNLRDDPSEKQNLAAAMPDRVGPLRQQLAAWRSEVGAVMPTAGEAQ
jgi:arylsulfatase A-like enzyme